MRNIFLTLLVVALLTGLLIAPWVARKSAAAEPREKRRLPFNKVMVIVLENSDFKEALKQPGLAALAEHGALLEQFRAETHPSQPNYIALVSGDVHGVKNDSPASIVGSHLGDRMNEKGLSWKAYLEDYPGNCFTGERSGDYVRKHNPFISFVGQDAGNCSHLVNAQELAKDVQAGNIPDFSLYIPNLKNDGHDTSVGDASRWFARKFLPTLGKTMPPGLLLVVTFDESESKKDNRIYTVLYGSGVRVGAKSSLPYNHYNLLKTIERRFDLKAFGKNDSEAAVISDVWN